MTQIKKTVKLSRYIFYVGVVSVLAFVLGNKNNVNSEYISDSNPSQIPLVDIVHADVVSSGTGTDLGGEGCDGGGDCDGGG